MLHMFTLLSRLDAGDFVLKTEDLPGISDLFSSQSVVDGHEKFVPDHEESVLIYHMLYFVDHPGGV
jgi:hypothetical protein